MILRTEEEAKRTLCPYRNWDNCVANICAAWDSNRVKRKEFKDDDRENFPAIIKEGNISWVFYRHVQPKPGEVTEGASALYEATGGVCSFIEKGVAPSAA